MQKSNIIAGLIDRLNILEKWRGEGEPEDKKKTTGKKLSKPAVDEEVCPVCGSNLVWVEQGIVYCEKCKEYYEYEED